MGPNERLTAYIRAAKGASFAWGVNDCLTFTNGAYTAMHGFGWADDWLGRYMVDGRPMRRDELKREFKWSTLEEAIDDRMDRTQFPPRGALVTTKHSQRWVTGVAMGICLGTRCVFLNKQGLVYLPLNLIENAWVKRHDTSV